MKLSSRSVSRRVPGLVLLAMGALLLGADGAMATEGRVRVALLGGFTVADLEWEPTPDFAIDSRSRGEVGASFEVQLHQGAFLDFRLMYQQLGVELSATNGRSRLDLDYVRVPMLLKLKTSGEGAAAYAMAGMGLGFRLDASVDEPAAAALIGTAFDDFLTGIDVTVDAGLGIEVPIGEAKRTTLLLEGMYQRGIRTIIDQDAQFAVTPAGSPAGMTPLDDLRTKAFLFHVGLRF